MRAHPEPAMMPMALTTTLVLGLKVGPTPPGMLPGVLGATLGASAAAFAGAAVAESIGQHVGSAVVTESMGSGSLVSMCALF